MRFVDRDMFMRYIGLGVGHSYSVCLPDDESCRASPPVDEDIDSIIGMFGDGIQLGSDGEEDKTDSENGSDNNEPNEELWDNAEDMAGLCDP